MKIAYLSLRWPRTMNSGVGKKISCQMNHWRQSGNSVQLFMHYGIQHNHNDLIPGLSFTYTNPHNKIGLLINEIKALKLLIESISQYKPDLVYMRSSMYIYPIHIILENFKTIIEINSLDIGEHKLLGKMISLYNAITRSIIYSRASGMVFVSRQLASMHEYSSFNKPFVVISNGIDIKRSKEYPAPSNKIPRILFIGTPGMRWHGVDNLVGLAKRFTDLNFDIIGYKREDFHEDLPNNFKPHGFLKSAEYEHLMKIADIAIGSIALHRIQVDEVPPLKTRECVAHGIPFILPYIDTDLDSINCQQLLKIPNTPDNIQTHGQAIHDFAYRMRGQRVPRELIAPLINSEEKEKQRLQFFREIIDSKYSN